MKVVQINATCGIGSTGKICVGISNIMTANNIENYILYSSQSNGYHLGIAVSNDSYLKFQALKSRVLGNYGFNSYRATSKIIAELQRINPDIVHLHNIHGHDCHIEMLFNYLKKNKIKVIWTFHDCWAFTAYCPHFTIAKCDKWLSSCNHCIQRGDYSWLFDRSCELFKRKKKAFEGLDLTIITPSKWLAEKVKQSFLSDFPISVINNGIDLDIFRPYPSAFRNKYNIVNNKLILGVSFGWDERKGVDVFVNLAKRIPEDYKIVLVGTNNEVDKQLTDNVISIHKTNNQQELAEIYTASDLFVNPTREENYPTVNMESLACGTPVLTFRTGGSPEIIDDTCGAVVDCDDIEVLEREIIRICEDKPYSREDCLRRARSFDKKERFKEYLELYEGVDITRNQKS